MERRSIKGEPRTYLPRVRHASEGSTSLAQGAARAPGGLDEKGECWDNAVAESFFGTLKTELIGDSIPSSVDAASAAIGEYIEVFYNARRRHSSIGYASPIEYELKSQILSAAAW